MGKFPSSRLRVKTEFVKRKKRKKELFIFSPKYYSLITTESTKILCVLQSSNLRSIATLRLNELCWQNRFHFSKISCKFSTTKFFNQQFTIHPTSVTASLGHSILFPTARASIFSDALLRDLLTTADTS